MAPLTLKPEIGTLLLIRHAESEWNRIFGPSRIDPGIPDPSITAEGEEAAHQAARELVGRPFTRIVTSPYRRTVQTSGILAAALALPIQIDPLVRERCAFSCDQGSPPDELARLWPDLDFGGLDRRWWGGVIESMESLSQRAEAFLARARTWPDRDHVLVVSHWGFIRCVTGAEVGNLAAIRVTFD